MPTRVCRVMNECINVVLRRVMEGINRDKKRVANTCQKYAPHTGLAACAIRQKESWYFLHCGKVPSYPRATTTSQSAGIHKWSRF